MIGKEVCCCLWKAYSTHYTGVYQWSVSVQDMFDVLVNTWWDNRTATTFCQNLAGLDDPTCLLKAGLSLFNWIRELLEQDLSSATCYSCLLLSYRSQEAPNFFFLEKDWLDPLALSYLLPFFVYSLIWCRKLAQTGKTLERSRLFWHWYSNVVFPRAIASIARSLVRLAVLSRCWACNYKSKLAVSSAN